MRHMTVGDEKPQFAPDEFLSADQIKSYWSRLAQKQRQTIVTRPSTIAASAETPSTEEQIHQSTQQLTDYDEIESEEQEWLEDPIFNSVQEDLFNEIIASENDINID